MLIFYCTQSMIIFIKDLSQFHRVKIASRAYRTKFSRVSDIVIPFHSSLGKLRVP